MLTKNSRKQKTCFYCKINDINDFSYDYDMLLNLNLCRSDIVVRHAYRPCDGIQHVCTPCLKKTTMM